MKNKSSRYFLPLMLAVMLTFGLMAGASGIISYADEYLSAAETTGSDPPDYNEENNGSGGDVDDEEDNGNGGDADGEEDNGGGSDIEGEDDAEKIFISTGQELYDLANALNNGQFAEVYGTDISDAKVTLANDIDLKGFNFVPIGTPEYAFKGEFDGAGFTVSSLTINREDGVFQGLFGVVGTGALIHDVRLTGAKISGAALVGGIAGVMEFAAISNCQVDGDITANDSLAGGIAGGAIESTIEGCATSGMVTAAVENAGGIVGAAAYDNCFVRNCSSSMVVTVPWGTGGIVGSLTNANLQGCGFSGTLVSHSEASGGMAGDIETVEITDTIEQTYETVDGSGYVPPVIDNNAGNGAEVSGR